MEKLFDKLPYDDLEEIQFTHLLAGAIGIGLVLFLAYFFTLHSISNEEFENFTKKKKDAERTLQRYRATIANEGQVAKNMARVKGQFDAFKNQMPGQDEIPGLMQKIAAFGENRNIKMIALTLEEGEIGDFYKEIPLKVQINGELWVTLDFIEYMQNLLRLVSFEDLILQGRAPNSKAKGTGPLNTTLTAKTYSFLEGSENRAGKTKESPKAEVVNKKKGH
ncbi:MAG: type 4a pilus biogenesis protein PilO [Nitrospinae bacterium]|nr:type 4a pilus biogenesis protein PilO [Nitrospinota bacterium]MBL7019539.1 type 4a pilus biogenesis protein PilO [Nitrospinaceae bacterium]